MKKNLIQDMKLLLRLVLLMLLLSACTQTPQASIDAPIQVPSSPAMQTMATPTDDPILEGIRFSLSNGSHATKCSCVDCHADSETTGKTLSWPNPETGRSESVFTPTELCVKCHPSQVAVSPSQSSSPLAHQDFGCTNCHNPHSTKANCTGSGCHSEIANIMYAQIEQPANHPTSGDTNTHMCDGDVCHNLAKQVKAGPIYHQPIHREVPCYVCHDGTHMSVAYMSDQSWVTVIDFGEDSETELRPVVSHLIGLEVMCEKCHYTSNPWGVVEILPGN